MHCGTGFADDLLAEHASGFLGKSAGSFESQANGSSTVQTHWTFQQRADPKDQGWRRRARCQQHCQKMRADGVWFSKLDRTATRICAAPSTRRLAPRPSAARAYSNSRLIRLKLTFETFLSIQYKVVVARFDKPHKYQFQSDREKLSERQDSILFEQS